MAPEIVDQASGAPRAAVAAQQHLPALIKLVGLRLDLAQQGFQLLARLVQIIGFLPLIGPDVAAFAAQLLQHLHLHRQRQLQQRQQQPPGQQGQAALLIERHRRLKTAVVGGLGHLAAAADRAILHQTGRCPGGWRSRHPDCTASSWWGRA